jgi:opacity protein-like surface antigen
MKKICLAVLLCILAAAGLAAQAKPLNAMSLNGVTGLYVVPTARLGWEDADVGFNGGYHMNFVESELDDIFQANLSLFKWIEIAASYIGQPNDDDDDLLLGAKFRLPITGTAVALGGNIHYGGLGASGDHLASQIYGVVTYQAEFFGMPADTTLMIGKTFFQGDSIDSSIDFGMGFDLIIFPQFLNRFVHWIVDFSNFGYSQGQDFSSLAFLGNQAGVRGMVNTGLRIDLGQIPVFSRFNFVVDAYLTDAFDAETRYFGIGAMFGMKF